MSLNYSKSTIGESDIFEIYMWRRLFRSSEMEISEENCYYGPIT